MKERRKEIREEGGKEGRMEGRKEGRKQGSVSTHLTHSDKLLVVSSCHHYVSVAGPEALKT